MEKLNITELLDKKRLSKIPISQSELTDFILSLEYNIEYSSFWHCLRYGLKY